MNTLNEAKQVGSAFLVTGAFNPYTRGHEEVAKIAAQHAHGAGYSHFYHGLGASENRQDAPLSFKQKEQIVRGSHEYIKKGMPKTRMTFGIVPQQSSVSPLHQIVHLIERGGHKHITVALGPDQMTGDKSLRAAIEKHMTTHGGILGSNQKTVHRVKVDFHSLAEKRSEEELSLPQLKSLVKDGRIPVEHAKAGRLRKAILAGDTELAHAFMPDSIHAAKKQKHYADMISKQFKDVVPAAEEKARLERNKKARERAATKRKKKLTEMFSVAKIEEFMNMLAEAKIVQATIQNRKNTLNTALYRQHQAAIVNKESPQQRAARVARTRFHVRTRFAREIIGAKQKEAALGLDKPPRRVGTVKQPKRGTMLENILFEAKRKAIDSPSRTLSKARAESRPAKNKTEKDKHRKREERRHAKRKPNFAVVIGADKKIRIVKKEDIGKSKVVVSPEKFNRGQAKKYLQDPKFEITDSSKKLFPEFSRAKPKGKTKSSKKNEKSKTKKKTQQKSTLTKKPPKEVLQQQFPLPKVPPRGKKVTSPKSQYDDWDHSATELEEAIPFMLNQMLKAKTDTDVKGITEKIGKSQTLAAAAQRAVDQIIKQVGPVVAIHMGKNNGKLTKQWLSAGGVNATSKSDVVLVPADVWKTSGGKLENVDPKKCIRASMKCGAARILNGESGEAIATVEAANRYAGNIVAKSPKVAKLFKQAKDMISQFAKSAELGEYEIGEIKKIAASGELPKDKEFAKYRAIVESQEKLASQVAAKLQEIFDASEEFKMGLILESFTGNEKFGSDTLQAANYVLGVNADGTGVKLEAISEKMIQRIVPDLQFRGAFKGRSRKSGGKKIRTLSTLYNIDYKPSRLTEQSEPFLQTNFANNAAVVEQDLRMIGDDVMMFMEYCDLEPAMIASNELDVTDYMEGSARNYNIITIDGKQQIAIPVQDFQQFEELPQQLSETYDFINDFIVENLENEEALTLILTSGLVSPETITKSIEEIDAGSILNEMWEASLIKPELYESFVIEARNYKKEYKNYHSKPEQRANRSKRVLARRKMIKKGRVKKGDGNDVHHEDGNPQNNGDSNLKVLSKSKNRSMNEEHGAGEEGTDELRKKFLSVTPYSVDPIKKIIKGVVKHGIKHNK